MGKIYKLFYRPSIMVPLFTIVSALLYCLIALFVEVEDFNQGLMFAIIIPIIVTGPISLLLMNAYKEMVARNEELRNKDAFNKKLFTIIAHDIQSPLKTFKGLIDVVIDEDIPLDSTKEYLKSVSARIDDLGAFIKNLLSWSKMHQDNKPFVPVRFNTEEIIPPIFKLYNMFRENKGVKLDHGNLNAEVCIDKGVYAFIVRNIIHNAIKFTPAGKSIYIEVKDMNDEVYTVIRDEGIGMDKETLKKVMDTEQWYTHNGTNDEVGSGFGVNTIIQYLSKQNGKLLIETEEGKGTTVTIVLAKP